MIGKKLQTVLKYRHNIFKVKRFSYSTSTNPSYIYCPGKEPLFYRTIGQQLDLAVAKYGNNEALISTHENIRITYSELKEKADRLASGLIEIGLQPGDRFGIWSPNSSMWVIAMMAAARAGLITVGLNPAYQIPEVEFCLKKVNVKAILAAEPFKTQNYYEMLKKIMPELDDCKPGELTSKRVPSLKSVIVNTNDKTFNGIFRLNDIMSMSSEQTIKSVESLQSSISPDSCCNIQFTSGTTGEPKAALLSHFNYVNNSYNISLRNELHNKHHRALIQMPFFHAYAVVIVILAGMHHGTTHVNEGPIFKADQSVNAILKEKCTFLYGTPTMFVDLIQKCRIDNTKFNTLEIGVTGGAACSPQLFEDIKNVLGLSKIKTVFGLTEVSAVAFQSLINDSKEKTLETVGHVQDHLEVKIIDENGNVVPFGTPGELCIRGYSTMMGYWGDEQRTKDVLDTAKWFRTGDKFLLSEDGYGRIVGRIKEMVIRGGENIAPKEIEDFMNTHPDVLETHVVGVPDERMGEELCAFVRPANGKKLSLAELKEFSKGKIAHFKIPKYLRICDSFPKTTSGKVQKFKLRQQFQP